MNRQIEKVLNYPLVFGGRLRGWLLVRPDRLNLRRPREQDAIYKPVSAATAVSQLPEYIRGQATGHANEGPTQVSSLLFAIYRVVFARPQRQPELAIIALAALVLIQ